MTLTKNGMRDKQITVLADSGSSWSLIGEEYKHFAQDIREIPPSVVLVSATGSPISGAGIALFKIRIGNTEIMTDMFLVSKEVKWNYSIIGMTLMEKLQCNIDLKNKRLSIYPHTKAEDHVQLEYYASHVNKRTKESEQSRVNNITNFYQQARPLHSMADYYHHDKFRSPTRSTDDSSAPGLADTTSGEITSSTWRNPVRNEPEDYVDEEEETGEVVANYSFGTSPSPASTVDYNDYYSNHRDDYKTPSSPFMASKEADLPLDFPGLSCSDVDDQFKTIDEPLSEDGGLLDDVDDDEFTRRSAAYSLAKKTAAAASSEATAAAMSSAPASIATTSSTAIASAAAAVPAFASAAASGESPVKDSSSPQIPTSVMMIEMTSGKRNGNHLEGKPACFIKGEDVVMGKDYFEVFGEEDLPSMEEICILTEKLKSDENQQPLDEDYKHFDRDPMKLQLNECPTELQDRVRKEIVNFKPCFFRLAVQLAKDGCTGKSHLPNH